MLFSEKMIFDPANKHKLWDEERFKILPPIEILKEIGLKSGDVIVDVGCGNGYFTIPASEIVRPHGKVYACDISNEMLDDLKSRLTTQGNIETILSEKYHIPLPNEIADIMLIANVLHEVENKVLFLRELQRLLRTDGRLAIIDWLPIEMEKGPPLHERLNYDQIIDFAISAKFKLVSYKTISDMFHFFVFIKESSYDKKL